MTKTHLKFTGGALALLLTSTSAFAAPMNPSGGQLTTAARAALILAQAQACGEGTQPNDAGECVPVKPKAEPAPEPKAEPAPEPKAEPAPEPKAEPAPEPKAEPAPEPKAEPKPEPAPEPKAEPAPEPKAEKPAEAAPAEKPAEPAAEPAPAPKADAPAEEPAKPRRNKPAAEQPAEKPAEAAPAEKPAEPAAEPAPEPKAEQPAKPRRNKPAAEQPAEAKPADQAPAEKPAEAAPAEKPAEPTAEKPAEAKPAEQAPAEKPTEAAPAEKPAEGQPAGQEPAQQPAQPAAPSGEAPAQPAQPDAAAGQPAQPEAKPDDGKRAPIFDSQKSRPDRQRPDAGGQAAQPETPPAPPPADDKAAQEAAQPTEIVPVTQEKGERRREAPSRENMERPAGAEVLRKLGDRLIINLDNRTYVESDDRQRMRGDAEDVFYEDLPRGRTREVIQRRDGSQLITVRDRNGDIVRRSRVMQDGREIVLNYVDEAHYDNDSRGWRDPGDDLPPMRVDISEEDYILDSERASDSDTYYNFLREPPVEKVERLYSIDDVKRSARIRDKTRRVDLDTVTFEFGKADVPESQVNKLQNVAEAMEKLIKSNPAESFLIEGHTDAVGTDDANLALSDRRAEAVAEALTNVFGIPPENMATQGYGERYLKVRSQQPQQENRRVAIRRITPLVAPVASGQ